MGTSSKFRASGVEGLVWDPFFFFFLGGGVVIVRL